MTVQQIKEIADIQEKTNVLLGRKKVVEKLQFNRGQAVLLLNELIRLSPDGVQMRSLEQKNETLSKESKYLPETAYKSAYTSSPPHFFSRSR